LYPNKEQLEANKMCHAKEVLQAISAKSPPEFYGPDTENLIEGLLKDPEKAFNSVVDLLFSSFLVLVEKQFCLPSKLLKDIDQITEELSCIMATKKECESVLSSVYTEGSKTVLNCFYSDLVLMLGRRILHFISESAMKNEGRPSVKRVLSDENRQVIHYVSGSIVRAFLRRSTRFKKSARWIRVGNAIKQCILEGEENPAASNSDTYWKDSVNRGGLLVVGERFMCFMVSLEDLFCSVERSDGSLVIEDVLEKLLVSPARSLWDNVIGSMLPEEESLSFMIGVAKSFAC